MINQLKLMLTQQTHIKLAILFGSCATNTARTSSDLDIAIKANHQLTAPEKMQIISDLAIEFGRPVDLIDLYTVGEPLLGQIIRHGKKIIDIDNSYPKLIIQHLFNQADFVTYQTAILNKRRQKWIVK